MIPRLIGVVGRSKSGKDTVGTMIADEIGGQTIAFADPLKRLVQSVFQFQHDTLWGPSEMRNIPDGRYGAQDHSISALIGSWVCSRTIRANKLLTYTRLAAVSSSWLDDVLPGWRTRHPDAANKLWDWLTLTLNARVVTARRALQLLGTEFGRAIHEDIWVDYAMRHANTLFSGDRVDHVIITDVRFPNEARRIRAVGGGLWKVMRPDANTSDLIKVGGANHSSEAHIDSPEMNEAITQVIVNDWTLDELRLRVRNALAQLR